MSPDRLLRFARPVEAWLAREAPHVVVTGAGGWLGSATLEMLDDALGARFDGCVTVYAHREREAVLRSGRRLRLRALADIGEQPPPDVPVLLAHYAFLTREKVGNVGISTYVEANRAITALASAQARRLRVAGTFSTSSGAVYRRNGTLNDDLAANPYGALKLEEEEAFARLRDTGALTAICRVFNVAGPFLNKAYAIGDLIRAALYEPALTIQARHRVYRSYAHVADIVSVGFAAMAGLAAAPEPYDTAGLEVVEVGDLAERIRAELGCPAKPIRRAPLGDACDDRYVGRIEPFASMAARAGFALSPLGVQIQDTARFLVGGAAG